MILYPVKNDARYSIDLEWCGFDKPKYVLRFCDEWVDCFQSKSAAIVRAVGDKARREGALTVQEVTA
jgi:hypothetical protein